jgi:SAM-dependent methyltransferase
MNAEEYEKMAAVERDHWYYAGKRDIVRGWIERVRAPQAGEALLDCGAGTGIFAREMAERCEVYVLDDHEESLRILREHFPAERILALAGDRVPLPDASLEYVTALDVLEHTPDDAAVVAGFARLLRPGGLAVVTVPAGMALWSDWDVVLHHFRRYDRGRLEALFPARDWEIVHANYTNVAVYPVVWALRRLRTFPSGAWWGKKTAAEEGGVARAEDTVPAPWLNRFLRWVFVWCGTARVRFPFGVSLVLVARRR